MGRYLADAVDRVSQHNRILQSQDQREAETIGAIRSKGIQRICRGLFERDVVTNSRVNLLRVFTKSCTER